MEINLRINALGEEFLSCYYRAQSVQAFVLLCESVNKQQ